MLLACLKYFAHRPCPRCLIVKDRFGEMGTRHDLQRRDQQRIDGPDTHWRIRLARQWIYEDGLPLTSVHIKRILDDRSLTPTRVRTDELYVAWRANVVMVAERVLTHVCREGPQLLFTVCARPST